MKTRNKILSLLGILLGITFVFCIAASCNSEERKLSSEVKKITKSKHSYASLTNDSLFEPVHIKIASKTIAKVRFPKYRTSSLS